MTENHFLKFSDGFSVSEENLNSLNSGLSFLSLRDLVIAKGDIRDWKHNQEENYGNLKHNVNYDVLDSDEINLGNHQLPQVCGS